MKLGRDYIKKKECRELRNKFYFIYFFKFILNKFFFFFLINNLIYYG